MGAWDSTGTLGSLVPGLSQTLKDTKQTVADSYNAEQSAKNKIVAQANTKLALVQAALSQANQIIANITANLDSTGVSKLYLGPAGGGYSALSTEISAATNKPLLTGSGYYAGILLLVSAPDLTQVISLQKKLDAIFNIQ